MGDERIDVLRCDAARAGHRQGIADDDRTGVPLARDFEDSGDVVAHVRAFDRVVRKREGAERIAHRNADAARTDVECHHAPVDGHYGANASRSARAFGRRPRWNVTRSSMARATLGVALTAARMPDARGAPSARKFSTSAESSECISPRAP